MVHQTILTAVLLLSAGVLGAPAAETASSLMPRKGEYLGGIDMDAACREQWGNLAYVTQRGNTCNSWTCNIFDPDFPVAGLYVDVNRACTVQHGVSAYGWCTTDASGWGCFKN